MDLVFTFDDGRSDNLLIAQLLNQYGLSGTFFITTGFIDGSFNTDVFGVGRKALKVYEIKSMLEMGMDISSHGDCHIMDVNDFNVSIAKLKKWGINKAEYNFSVPNSSFTDNDLLLFHEQLSNLKYVRVGRNEKCYSFLNKINYLLYHLFHFQVNFNNFNKNNLIYSFNSKKIYSLVVKKDTKVKNLINFIKKFEKENCLLVLMFHSVVSKPNDNWEYSLGEFKELINFVSSNKFIRVSALDQIKE